MQVQLTGDANDAVHIALFMCYSTIVMKKNNILAPGPNYNKCRAWECGRGPISSVLTNIGKFDGYICSFLGPNNLYVSPIKYNAIVYSVL